MLFLLTLLVFIGLFSVFAGADMVTSCYHLYRCQFMPRCFTNKTLWIVGSSSGLGEMLVYEAAKNNAKNIIISARRKEQLQRVAKLVNKQYPNTNIIIAPFDLLQFVNVKNGRKNCQEFIKKTIKSNKLSNIDSLVLNSGLTARGLGVGTDLTVFEKLMNLNVYALVIFTQSFVSVLRDELHWIHINNNIKNEERGIYITSSIAGCIGAPGQSAYAASKHAINGFMRSLRFELVSENIHIGIVNPGPFRPSENSNDGLGKNLNETSGRLIKKDIIKKKMTSERTAKLYTTVIACRITEAWLASHSVLLFTYVMQYCPILTSILGKFVGPGQLKHITRHKNKS